MRIDQLALEQYQPLAAISPPATRAVDFSASLNVLDCRREGFALSLSDLVGHVLYGARFPGRGALDAEGYVDVSSPLGRYRLRRSHEAGPEGRRELRLTVAPLEGQPAQPDTARRLLGRLSPSIAARLMAPRFNETESHLAWLFGAELAQELERLEQDPHPNAPGAASSRHQELFALRDRLTHELETLLGEKRRRSMQLDVTLQELEQQQAELRESLHTARQSFDRVVAEIAQFETERRYRELAEMVERTADQVHHAERQEELEQLDVEIARWREMLAELERREAQVRLSLSQLHPDEASPRLPLADQRAAVAIAERLVSDLDSEVARLARSGDQACVCLHAHARLHPLVDTLGDQIDTLARLIGQYEGALAAQQMRREAEHLARAQGELRATLDHLLDRRQEGLRSSRSRKPSDTRFDTVPLPHAHPQARYEALERQQSDLQAQIRSSEQRLASLEVRLEEIRGERTRLMTDPTLTRLQQELDEANRQLQSRDPEEPALRARSAWRTSEILAKLTDGRLREVRLIEGGRDAEIVDRHGQGVAVADLVASDQLLLAISFHLAAVAAVAVWGESLPLLLAEPFTGLSSQESAILALVLHDFARAGHQVVVFTSNSMALDRWRAAGQSVIDWQQHSRVVEDPTARTRLVVSPEVTRVAVTREAPAIDDTFTLLVDDPIERFPVLGGEGTSELARLGIRTVGDLVEADPATVARGLDRTDVTTQVVEIWQAHATLLLFVPRLDLNQVQLLTSIGVWRPEQLAAARPDELAESARQYLADPANERLRKGIGKPTRDMMQKWIEGAAEYRSRWEQSRVWRAFEQRNLSVARPATRPKRAESERAKSANATGRNGTAKKGSRNQKTSAAASAPRALQFRLSRSSKVEDAPSIGPKMAKRLARLGVKNIAQLLSADATKLADGLSEAGIDAAKVVAWQHESQLMCRVPELLARDAQVLVGSGFTSAEEIAKATAAELWEFVKSYCATSAGKRQLRGAAPPDLARVTKWIRWAGHRRALDAA